MWYYCNWSGKLLNGLFFKKVVVLKKFTNVEEFIIKLFVNIYWNNEMYTFYLLLVSLYLI